VPGTVPGFSINGDPNINPYGYASNGSGVFDEIYEFQNFSFGTSTWVIDTSTGDFEIRAHSGGIVASYPVFDAYNEEISPYELLDPPIVGTNSGTIDQQAQTGRASWDMYNDVLGTFSFLSGEIYVLYRDQDPTDYLSEFGESVVSNFAFLISSGVLPEDWVGIATSSYTSTNCSRSTFTGDLGTCHGSSWNVFNWVYTESDIRLAAVPEPTTLGLFAAGLAGLGFSARRRKQAH